MQQTLVTNGLSTTLKDKGLWYLSKHDELGHFAKV